MIPLIWYTAIIILLFKKGDKLSLKNYRPISLLYCIYKLFTKIITIRLTEILDFNQPREQVGFRKDFSTIDHLQVLNQLIEKTNEFNIPLVLLFIDYEKAFDTIEINALLSALNEQGIPGKYIKFLQIMNKNSNARIKMHKVSDEIKLKRGVRQGDSISHKLFTSCLESVFRK